MIKVREKAGFWKQVKKNKISTSQLFANKSVINIKKFFNHLVKIKIVWYTLTTLFVFFCEAF